MGVGRIVEVSEHGRHLSLDRGFLVVREGDEERGRVPLDDIGAVVLSAYGTSYTTPLIVALVERGAIIVTCGKNHLPVAWTLPVVGHHAQTRIVAAQVDAPKPLNKRLWQYIVQTKIAAQADALEALGKSRALLDGLIDQVQSGDPTNVEARAAQAYWPALLGPTFRRDREADGINSVLNYGYTVLRASTARAIVASGLHPSVSIKHRRDPLALSDDVMEPFRPVVDGQVAILAGQDRRHLTWEIRETCVEALGDVEPDLLRFVQSISKAYVEGIVPKWKVGQHVADRSVRSAGDGGERPQTGYTVSEPPEGFGVRDDAVLGLCAEVPRADRDLDEEYSEILARV